MILQALTAYYDHLVEDGKLDRPGWQPVKVYFALQIDREGRLVRVLPLMHLEMRGNKDPSISFICFCCCFVAYDTASLVNWEVVMKTPFCTSSIAPTKACNIDLATLLPGA